MTEEVRRDHTHRWTPFEVLLADGTRVLLRPIGPDDKQRLADGFGRLSAESRYRRFFSPTPRLSASRLRYLTEVDQHDHVAWAAVDPTLPGEPGLGVVRFVRLADEPWVAEVAVTVLDEVQGRGLGTTLLGLAAGLAPLVGVTILRAMVLRDNAAMRQVLNDIGVRPGAVDDSTFEVDIEVPPDFKLVPSSGAGHAFLRVAEAAAKSGMRSHPSPEASPVARGEALPKPPPDDETIHSVFAGHSRQMETLAAQVGSALAASVDGDGLDAIWMRFASTLLARLEAGEEMLLPALKAAHPHEIRELLGRHDRIRAQMASLQLAVERKVVEVSGLQQLIDLLRAHFAAEENGLHAWADVEIPAEDRPALIQRLRRALSLHA